MATQPTAADREHVATKTDIAEVKTSIAQAETRLLRWFVSALGVSVAFIAAIVTFLH